MRLTITVKGIPQAVKEVERRVHQTARSFVLRLWEELYESTPKSSGRAAASWDITTGSEVDLLPPGIYGRPPTPIVPRKFDDIFIINPLGYLRFLNEGSSDKAPALFIESSVRNIEDEFAT